MQNEKTGNIIKSNLNNIPASITTVGSNGNIMQQQQNYQQNLENSISIIKQYTRINISYEKSSNEIISGNDSKNIKHEFFTLLNQLGETNICPYYYFNNIINQGTADLIICSYKDFFDPKNRIKIKNLIPENERKNYKLIFDECGDIEYLIQDYFSMNIDENVLQFTSDDLFILREKYKIFADTNVDNKQVKIKENNREEVYSKKLIVENEILEFNHFSRKFLGKFNIRK